MATITLKKTKLNNKLVLVEKEYEFVPELWEIIKDYMIFQVPVKEGEYVIGYYATTHKREYFELWRRVPSSFGRLENVTCFKMIQKGEARDGKPWMIESKTEPGNIPPTMSRGWEQTITGAWKPCPVAPCNGYKFLNSFEEAVSYKGAFNKFFKTDIKCLDLELVGSLTRFKTPK